MFQHEISESGVVPRTFIGPLVVSAAAYPLVWLSSNLGASKFVAQFIGKSNFVNTFTFLWS